MRLHSKLRRWPLLLAALPLFALAQEPPRQAILAFQMAVDDQGRPTAIEPPQGLPPSIGETVATWAKGLRFVPASVDGVPQSSTTTLRVTFDTSDPNAVAIARAVTGPGVVFGDLPPGPDNDAAGYFVVEYDAAGRVTQVALDEAHSPMSSKKFTRWADRFLSGARFTPETVAGQPVPGSVRIPLLYCHRPARCDVTLAPLPGSGAPVPNEIIPTSVLARMAVPAEPGQ